jgi:hypothetical protein
VRLPGDIECGLNFFQVFRVAKTPDNGSHSPGILDGLWITTLHPKTPILFIDA